jgi:2-amino-4-hydroxy-6-hydroxymethyldihydropteridine diphosphokinase
MEMGREPGRRWGPRVIDLDILLYGTHIVNLPNLIIPHKRLVERKFILEQLVELDRNLKVPGTGKLCTTFLEKL